MSFSVLAKAHDTLSQHCLTTFPELATISPEAPPAPGAGVGRNHRMTGRDVMRKLIGVVAGIVALLLVVAGMLSEPSSAVEGTLTTADRVEIRDLYNRYNHYIDNVKDNGDAFAGLFTEDAVFETNIAVGTRTGHDELARLAREVGSSTKVSPGHLVYNIVIDPSPEGAVGSAYYGVTVRPHEEGNEARGWGWGIYTDRLVKTADGWRFKYRKYTPSGWDHPEEWAAH